MSAGRRRVRFVRIIQFVLVLKNELISSNSFVVDCMDAGGRATHGAVAESLSYNERNEHSFYLYGK